MACIPGSTYSSTSAAMMRLWGPVPFSAAKSIPLSAASFFANGLAKILSPAGKQAQNIVIVLKPARRAHGPEGRAGAAGAGAEESKSSHCEPVALPYVFRYLTNELAGMNIRITLKMDNWAAEA